MQTIKERKSLLVKILTGVLLALTICYLPQELLFLKLCTEQDRDIPPNTEVLVSACKKPVVRGIPGGEVLFVYEVKTGKMYLLDLKTGEKRKVPNDLLSLDKKVFLSSKLVWLEGSVARPDESNYYPHYILDLVDGKKYELLDLDTLPRLEGGNFDPKNYAYIQSSDYIYIDHYNNVLIALPSNFQQHPENAVIVSQYAFVSGVSAEKGKLLEQLMRDLELDYEIIDFYLLYTDVPSPTNKYIARFDGIYLAETNQPVPTAAGMFGYFRSWYYDESGVVVQDGGDYLITLPGISTIYYVPSPILKLNLPVP